MTFLIRPYNGFTRRLRDLVSERQPGPVPLRVLVQGPYGHSRPFHRYRDLVFIVGGSGVVTALSYLQLFIGAVRRPRTQLHWAVREPEFAAEVITTDLGRVLKLGRLSLDLYMSSSVGEAVAVELPPGAQQHSSRPDVAGIVRAAVELAGSGSLAVVACGPAKMADDCRLAVVQALDSAECVVEYYEEKFEW